MYPSLNDGDKVLVLKTSKVQRGDIVLVNIPAKISVINPDRLSIKRLVAMPGDMVSAEDGRWINNTTSKCYTDTVMSDALASVSLDELCSGYNVFTSVFPFDDSRESIKYFGERVIPYAGMNAELSSFYARAADYDGCPAKRASYPFEQDYCFVLGDNAFDSRDSRYYGPVPFTEVKGKVVCRLKNNADRDLQAVLRQSGDNRIELEKVLSYCRRDDVKYRSAVYLIKNMHGHYSYALSDEDECVKDKMAGMYRKGRLSGEDLRMPPVTYRRKVNDVDAVTAKFLIDNIDAAVDVYRLRPWNKNLPFEDFCELILPYRVGTEPLEEWRCRFRDRYSYILDSLYTGQDPIEAVNAVYDALDGQLFMYYQSFSLPNLGGRFLVGQQDRRMP